MAEKKDVVVKEEALPSTDVIIDYAADAGDLGFQKEDLSVPFIRILQANSPQLARGNAKFIKEARSGDFINTVTQDLYNGEEGILVVPVAFTRSYTEWKPREEGGGLINDYGADGAILQKCTRNDRGQYILPNGNIISEAAHYFVFQLLGDGMFTQGILPFASTQWKKARTWNTVMSGMTIKTPTGMKALPMFATAWSVTTVAESNDSGDWMGYKIKKHAPIHEIEGGRDIYEAARGFKDMIAQGLVKAKHDEEGGSSGEATARPASGPAADDDIPF